MTNKVTHYLNGVILAGVAGLLAGGVICGIGGRIAMRLVALNVGMRPEFSLEGTIGLAMMGAVFGLVCGLLFGAIRPLLPLPGFWKGLAFGLTMAALIAIPFFREPQGELRLIPPAAGATLFGGLMLLYGLGTNVAIGWLESRQEGDIQQTQVSGTAIQEVQ